MMNGIGNGGHVWHQQTAIITPQCIVVSRGKERRNDIRNNGQHWICKIELTGFQRHIRHDDRTTCVQCYWHISGDANQTIAMHNLWNLGPVWNCVGRIIAKQQVVPGSSTECVIASLPKQNITVIAAIEDVIICRHQVDQQQVRIPRTIVGIKDFVALSIKRSGGQNNVCPEYLCGQQIRRFASQAGIRVQTARNNSHVFKEHISVPCSCGIQMRSSVGIERTFNLPDVPQDHVEAFTTT